jgi:hypothetical protein
MAVAVAMPIGMGMGMAMAMGMGMPPGVWSCSSRHGTHHPGRDRVHPQFIRTDSACGTAGLEGLRKARSVLTPFSPMLPRSPGLHFWRGSGDQTRQIFSRFQPIKSPEIRSLVPMLPKTHCLRNAVCILLILPLRLPVPAVLPHVPAG